MTADKTEPKTRASIFTPDQGADGGPAFPCYIPGHTDIVGCGGMSLRDWFAGQALVGMGHPDLGSTREAAESVAFFCYRIADAMLKEREK